MSRIRAIHTPALDILKLFHVPDSLKLFQVPDSLKLFQDTDKQKVPYFNVSRKNRDVFNCFATKHVKDVRSGQPLFCNQPPRGPESEPEIARVSQRESE